MKKNCWLGSMILAAWLVGAAGYAQETAYQPVFPAPSPLAQDAAPERGRGTIVPAAGVLSDWIVYRRDCCEGPAGRITPFYTEIYLSAGPSIPVGGETLSRELKTGWSIMGGARAMFFDESQTRAWFVDGHIINTNESAGRQNTQFPVTFFQNGLRSDQVNFLGVTGRTTFSIQNSNRTLVGLGLGRAWYPWQPANSDGCKWRLALDGGGRWGSGRVNFNEFGHLTDVIGAVYVGARSEFEVPCQAFLFHAGVRFEWSYTWSDVLQRTSDVQDLSVLLTIGVRY